MYPIFALQEYLINKSLLIDQYYIKKKLLFTLKIFFFRFFQLNTEFFCLKTTVQIPYL